MGFNIGQFVTLVQTHALNVDTERMAGASKLDELECKAIGAVAMAMEVKNLVKGGTELPGKPLLMVKWAKELVAFQHEGTVPDWLDQELLKRAIMPKKVAKKTAKGDDGGN